MCAKLTLYHKGGIVYIRMIMDNRSIGSSPATIPPFFQGRKGSKAINSLPMSDCGKPGDNHARSAYRMLPMSTSVTQVTKAYLSHPCPLRQQSQHRRAARLARWEKGGRGKDHVDRLSQIRLTNVTTCHNLGSLRSKCGSAYALWA